MSRDVPVNHQIRARKVRIVTEDGTQMGVVSFQEAQNMAQQQGLDLIQISKGEVPVCRIGDAGKFMFERKKAQRDAARRQREMQVDIKEVQLRPNTDENDLQVKARKANEFLAAGDKVKISVRFRGRENANKSRGRDIINAFLGHVIEYKVDRPISVGGRGLMMVIAPTRSKSEIIRDKK